MKLAKLKLLTPVMGIGRMGTANWLTAADVDMELRADGSVRVTRLSNGDPEIIVTPAAVAWYVPAAPEAESVEDEVDRRIMDLVPKRTRKVTKPPT